MSLDVAASIAKADELIESEIATQTKMWGADAVRADCRGSELIHAAQASCLLTVLKEDPGFTPAHESAAVKLAEDAFYPANWSGFRDYGNVYNLVVAAAFLRNEIARRIAAGQSFDRKPRQPDQTYNAATGLPAVSSAEARGEV